MTKPKLCPKTLRWAAQHIRKFTDPDETRWVRIFTNETYEHAAESLDSWATEAELAEAKRKADPGCTCSPSPSGKLSELLCPSCAACVMEFDRRLAASMMAAVEQHADALRNVEPALTVDQDKVDEHYGRIAYEAQCSQGEPPWKNLFPRQRAAWTQAAKAVCVEMAKAAGGGS